MATLKAKKLQQALQKAKNVGRVEEAVTISGCSLVLQNLAPEDYESIIQDTSDLEGAEYLHAYQIGHVSRAVVEIEGVDLRDVKYIEDEVPAGTFLINFTVPTEGQAKKVSTALKDIGIDAIVVGPEEDAEVRTVRLEKSEWVRQRLSTWGREAISVAYRKFADLLVIADQKAQEGIQFNIVDETAEDKFRRLLTEAKSLEDNLPRELIAKILNDVGYIPASTPEELAEMARSAKEFNDKRLAQMEEDDSEEAPKVTSKSVRELAEELTAERETEEDPVLPKENVDVQELMRRRVPLNRQVTSVPVPVQQVQSATPVAPVPSQLREAAMANTMSRSASIAALEAHVDPDIPLQVSQAQVQQTREIPELVRRATPVDNTVMSILDKPPTVGLNPKFRQFPK